MSLAYRPRQSARILADVRHTPAAGSPRDVHAILDLRWATGTGTLLGIYQRSPNGTFATHPVYPGDILNFLVPILNTSTGQVTTATQGTSLVVPAAGVSALLIYQALLPPGPVDLDIFVEDYSENLGYDWVTLTVP